MELINSHVKVVFSLRWDILKKFKNYVPARKRSEVIEGLISKYLTEETRRAGWEAASSLRNLYKPADDDTKLSAVDWLRQDRSSH